MSLSQHEVSVLVFSNKDIPAGESHPLFQVVFQEDSGWTLTCTRYLLAAVINLTVVPKVSTSWRALYFIGAGFSCLAAIVRAFLPESQQFILARQEAKERGLTSGAQSKAFAREVGVMLKTNWLRCIWAICIMTGKYKSTHRTTRRRGPS